MKKSRKEGRRDREDAGCERERSRMVEGEIWKGKGRGRTREVQNVERGLYIRRKEKRGNEGELKRMMGKIEG